MSLRPLQVLVLLPLAAALLSGCSETRRILGQDKAPPDEFAVVQRAPLTLPPDYSLRPPSPGAARPQETSTRDQAKTSLLGKERIKNTIQLQTQGRSRGELAMLKRTGADQAIADIRTIVNRETTALADAEKSFTDGIMFWQKKSAPGEAVDAAKETKRLRENEALGRTVSEGGQTPTIKRRQKGLFEGVFD